MNTNPEIAKVVIGETICYGDELGQYWYRKFTVEGVTFLAPLDEEDKARHILSRRLESAKGGVQGVGLNTPLPALPSNVRDFIADGWVVDFSRSTRFVGLSHRQGGRMSVAELEPGFEDTGDFLVDAIAHCAARLSTPPESGAFQQRVAPWMQECFGPVIAADKLERGDRFLEEALELLQSGGYERERVAALVEYVWSRPAGEPGQEVGGVRVTLSAYCLAYGIDEDAEAERELARILRPEIIAKIRAKQAAKARDIPFSPLPQAHPSPGVAGVSEAMVERFAQKYWGSDWGTAHGCHTPGQMNHERANIRDALAAALESPK